MPTEVSFISVIRSSYHLNCILAAQAQARIKILEKLPELETPETEDTESFKYALFSCLGLLLLVTGFLTSKRSLLLYYNSQG